MIGPGVSEETIHAAIHRSFLDRGARRVAFECIVGSGANAAIPHYEGDDQVMTRGLVVIDIGCMTDDGTGDWHASDMTRTFVVNGTPTAAEQRLLEVTVAAVEAARAALGPGGTMREVDTAAREVIKEAGFGDYFIHSVGHNVGLDVHDPGRAVLEPGMVVTIEPGIYITEGAEIDPAYWNLGVRLEDTYVVTETGWTMLTEYPLLPSSMRADPAG
jgi:Xaa-Pro aminopeptidase